jgi:putative glycosyltransferase (TIGR04348 family)
VRILIVTPARPGSKLGNRVTALRWQRALRALGHRVRIESELVGGRFDVVVALHARKSARAVVEAPVPVVLAMTGTDYGDLRRSAAARSALAHADRIVVLHELGARELPREVRSKVRVIEQSAIMPAPRRRGFDVVVVGHLRSEKDPFRAAHAARALPPSSRIRIVHIGGALSEPMRVAAEREMARNPRYLWVGEKSPAATRRAIADAKLLVLSSRIEGGANVLSEALVARTPILASRIASSVGVLGADYPGFFPLGDTAALTRMLVRAESDPAFYRSLVRASARRRSRFLPSRERAAWRALLSELSR